MTATPTSAMRRSTRRRVRFRRRGLPTTSGAGELRCTGSIRQGPSNSGPDLVPERNITEDGSVLGNSKFRPPQNWSFFRHRHVGAVLDPRFNCTDPQQPRVIDVVFPHRKRILRWSPHFHDRFFRPVEEVSRADTGRVWAETRGASQDARHKWTVTGLRGCERANLRRAEVHLSDGTMAV